MSARKKRIARVRVIAGEGPPELFGALLSAFFGLYDTAREDDPDLDDRIARDHAKIRRRTPPRRKAKGRKP